MAVQWVFWYYEFIDNDTYLINLLILNDTIKDVNIYINNKILPLWFHGYMKIALKGYKDVCRTRELLNYWTKGHSLVRGFAKCILPAKPVDKIQLYLYLKCLLYNSTLKVRCFYLGVQKEKILIRVNETQNKIVSYRYYKIFIAWFLTKIYLIPGLTKHMLPRTQSILV